MDLLVAETDASTVDFIHPVRESLLRLGRNLLNDINSKNTEEDWQLLSEFLRLASVTEHTRLRLTIYGVVVDLMEVLSDVDRRSDNHASLLRDQHLRLETAFDTNFVRMQCPNENFSRISTLAMRYAELRYRILSEPELEDIYSIALHHRGPYQHSPNPILFAYEAGGAKASFRILGFSNDHVNSYGSRDLSAPLLACQRGDLDYLKELMSKGGKLDRRYREDSTAVMLACENGHLEILKFLVSQRQNLRRKTKYNGSAITEAASNGHIHIIEYLLRKGVDPKSADKNGYSAFIAACSNGQVEVVKFLIGLGIDPNQQAWYRSSAAAVAAKSGHVEVLRALFEVGVDLKTVDKEGQNLASLAAIFNKPAVIDYLAYQNIDLELLSKQSVSPIMNAASGGNLEVCNALVNQEVTLMQRDRFGNDAFLYACMNAHYSCVKRLLEAGTNPQSKSRVGLNGIMAACTWKWYHGTRKSEAVFEDQKRVIKLLLSSGLRLSDKTAGFMSPARIANMEDHCQMVEFLASQEDWSAQKILELNRFWAKLLGCSDRSFAWLHGLLWLSPQVFYERAKRVFVKK